jgi:hypothetical protein
MPLVGGMIGVGIGDGLEKYPAGPTVTIVLIFRNGKSQQVFTTEVQRVFMSIKLIMSICPD